MVIKCHFCGRDNFKNEGGLKSHITWKHSSSPDGRGSRPPTSTRVQRDNGARPRNNILGHKDHYSDKDIIKDVAREVQRDSRQRGSQEEILFKDGAGGTRPKTSPPKYKEFPKQSRKTEETGRRPLSSASGGKLSCHATDFKKYVDMIEVEIRRPKEDSTFRTSEVNKFINALTDTMERRSNIPITLLKSGSYYDRTKIDYNNEFDFMFYPDIRMEADFTNCPPGYCKIRKGETVNKDLDPFIDKDGYLVPELYKAHMFDIFEKCRTDSSFRQGRRTQMKPRKPESPAYTLLFSLGIRGKTPIDIDLVPAIRIDGWPKTAREVKSGTWIDVNAAKKAMQCFYLVTKRYPEDHPDVCLLWRVSFSHAEKELILHANKSDNGCRKDILKILKKIKEDIKENIKLKTLVEMDKFCSYHLKMFILEFFDKQRNFSKENKYHLVKECIKQLAKCVRNGTIKNYFIPRDNVLQSVPEEERLYVIRELEDLIQLMI